MTLWDWSLRAWAAPGVSLAALDLQDAQAQCIPLLLWAAWAAQTGRPAGQDEIEAAADTARVWHETTIAPLRQVRRSMKSRIPDMDDAAREAVREGIKTIELQTERHLLEALDSLTPADFGPPRAVLPALVVASRAWSSVTPRTALALFADRLPT